MTDSQSRLDKLTAHRDQIELQLEVSSGSAFAALSARYLETLKQIDDLESHKPAAASVADELAAKRKRRKPVRNGETREQS